MEMDSTQNLHSISPSGGEGSARAEIRSHSIMELREALDRERVPLFNLVVKIVAPPDSAIGVISSMDEIANDLRIAGQHGIQIGGWGEALHKLMAECMTIAGRNVAIDRHLAVSLPDQTMKFFLAVPDEKLMIAEKSMLRTVRAIVILNSMAVGRPPGSELRKTVIGLFRGHRRPQLDFLQELVIDEAVLRNLRERLTLNSELEKLITLILNTISASVPEVPRLSKHAVNGTVQVIYREPCPADFDAQESPIENGNAIGINTGKATMDGQDKPGNHLDYLLSRMGKEGPRSFSGIADPQNHLQSFEIEVLIPMIGQHLDGPDRIPAALALLTFFLRCRPRRLNKIPIGFVSSSPVWVDLEFGMTCWILEFLTQNLRGQDDYDAATRTVVRVPLPAELVTLLRELAAQHPSAKTIGELFGPDLEVQDQATKKFVKSISLTSHRPRLTRLEDSYGRYVLHLCRDEAYAAAISLDFDLGTTSNFNYIVLRGDRLKKILIAVYSRLGLTCRAELNLGDVGASMGMRHQDILDCIRSALTEVKESVERMPRRMAYPRLVEAHNLIARKVLLAAAILTGHRPAAEYGFAMHLLDMNLRVALLCDKRVSEYLWARLVPIPSILQAWLQFYICWLESLRYRLSSIDLNLANAIDSVIRGESGRASAPMFFLLGSTGMTAMGTDDIADLFAHDGLATNCGRHLIDYMLRDRETDSASIAAWEGHASIGQESFGRRSALVPMEVLSHIRNVMDEAMDKAGIPEPPAIRGRDIKFRVRDTGQPYPPGLIARDYARSLESEPCPYDEFTLVRLRQACAAIRQWLEAPVHEDVADLALSMIFLSGVTHRDELVEAVRQLLTGKVYKVGEKYFVDAKCRSLGIRRVWINPVTLRLASQMSGKADIPRGDHLTLQIEKTLVARFANIPGLESMEILLACMRAVLTILMPGMVRAWSFGELPARTSRPVTVARHHYNIIERPSFNTGNITINRLKVSGDEFIRQEISHAADDTQYLGENDTRLRRLKNNIGDFLDGEPVPFHVEVLGQFVVHLCEHVGAPSTVLRYYGTVSQLLALIPEDVDNFELLAECDWKLLTARWLENEQKEDGAPEVTALNHFLDFIGVDLNTWMRRDHTRPSHRYCDYPADKEIARAIAQANDLSVLPDPRREQPGVALGILGQHAIRPGEIRKLRLADVCVDVQVPHIVVTDEATGSSKTINAPRALPLDLRIPSLDVLVRTRAGQLNNNPTAFILGDVESGRSNEDFNEVLYVAGKCLRLVTGSNVISIRNLRQYNVARQFREILHPDRASKDALYYRQAIELVSAQSGHGNTVTSSEHYWAGADELRRDWMPQILDSLRLRPSARFLGSITHVTEECYRQRKCRGKVFSFGDALEGFNLPDFTHLATRVVDLKDSLVQGVGVLNSDFPPTMENQAMTSAKYVAALLLYQSKHVRSSGEGPLLREASPEYHHVEKVAAYEAQIGCTTHDRIDIGLKLAGKLLNKKWHTVSKFDKREIIHSGHFELLATILGGLSLDIERALALGGMIQARVESSWALANHDQISFLQEIRVICSAHAISMQIAVRSDANLQCRRAVRHSGIPMLDLSDRTFPAGKSILVSFVPQGTTPESRPLELPRMMFQISCVALSLCAAYFGENHG